MAEAYGIGLSSDNLLDIEQISQEFQFIGSVGNRVEYVAGLYYFDEDADHGRDDQFVIAGSSVPQHYLITAESKSYAVYGQLTWTPPILDDQLSITFGARQTKDKRKAARDFAVGGVVIDDNAPFDKDFSRFTPSFTVAYNFSDTLNAYAKVATGYRSGGANESATEFGVGFGSETLISYEAGVKADWLDRRLRTNIAVFYSDYEDIQLTVQPDASDPSVTSTYNAGEAVIQGLEADVILAVTEDLQVTLGYALLDTDVKKVVIPGTTINAGDFVIPYSPENSVTLGIDWTFLHFASGSLGAALNYVWKDEAYNTAGAGPNVPGHEFYLIDSYGLLDGRLTVEYQPEKLDEPVKISLWGKNLLDKRTPLMTTAIGSMLAGYTSSNHIYTEPLSFGVEISFSL